jgi:hypothetical protein
LWYFLLAVLRQGTKPDPGIILRFLCLASKEADVAFSDVLSQREQLAFHADILTTTARYESNDYVRDVIADDIICICGLAVASPQDAVG